MSSKKQNVESNTTTTDEYLERGEAIKNYEKSRQLSRREAKKRAQYERMLRAMTPAEAQLLQDKREAREIMEYMEVRSKRAIKKSARKRMGIGSKVKSAFVGAIAGGAGYLGLSTVTNTQDREVTRPLNEEEYRNEVALNYLLDGDTVEGNVLVNSGIDWNSPDWHSQWLEYLEAKFHHNDLDEYKDKTVVDIILNGKEFNHAFYDITRKAPNGDVNYGYPRLAVVGTEAERQEMYTYAFQKKWGIDLSNMAVEDDAISAMQILNSQGLTRCQEFVNDLTLYRAFVPQCADYHGKVDNVSVIIYFQDYYENNYAHHGTFAGYLDAKEQEVIQDSYSINNVAEYTDFADFIRQIGQAVQDGNDLAVQTWHDYILINQSRIMMLDDKYYSPPSEILPMFGLDSTDPMFQKYAELGTQEATFARLLMLEHPGCNTFHSDGSIHIADSGTLTGEALTKFQEDLAYYQNIITKTQDIDALEYANNIYLWGYNREDIVDIDPTVTEIVPGDDPLTHIGIPSTILFAMGYLGWQRHKFRKAVSDEIMDDIIKARLAKEQAKLQAKKDEETNAQQQTNAQTQEETNAINEQNAQQDNSESNEDEQCNVRLN